MVSGPLPKNGVVLGWRVLVAPKRVTHVHAAASGVCCVLADFIFL